MSKVQDSWVKTFHVAAIHLRDSNERGLFEAEGNFVMWCLKQTLQKTHTQKKPNNKKTTHTHTKKLEKVITRS